MNNLHCSSMNGEYRHRGYYHFDTPIDIEVPYIPFRYTPYTNTPVIDDGRVPSLFKTVTHLLFPPEKKEEELSQELTEVTPRFLTSEDTPNLIGILISFPKGTEIIPSRNIEFLNMLSFTETPISFEIIGKADDIKIQIVCSEFDNERLYSLLKAYFPTAILSDIKFDNFDFLLKGISLLLISG